MRQGVAGGEAAELTSPPSIIDRVREHAASSPHAVAVEARGQTLSRAELLERVEAAAARLAPHAQTPGMVIGVCLERTVDLPIWLLAIFRVGCAYFPIDPSLPSARVATMLEDAGPVVVIASRTFAGRFGSFTGTVIDADDYAVDTQPAPPLAQDPTRLAYVIFTSGSTGRPKGVEVEHRSVLALVRAIARSPGLRPGGRVLAITRISFDLSVIDLFLPLYVGARLVILELDVAADPARLSAAVAHHRPDFMQATPATWRTLLEWGWTGAPGLKLLCGGEAMGRDLADKLLTRCAELWNVYGPTETTVWSTAHQVSAGTGAVPIGRPIPGTAVRIADSELRTLAAGEVGEIIIAGAGLARGYRGAPALTAERFVVLDDGTRAYRTGDLGRVGDDGLLYCLGRRDDQVKVRGFRIELGDVESAIASHPHVGWCAARAWTGPDGDAMLVAYVVSSLGGALPARDLKAFLATVLPAYMVPDRIVPLAEMPLTPNGKVDRKALPDPVVQQPASARSLDGDAERRMAAIWSDLLGVPVERADDDFFDLGGYSLITVRLLRRIEQEFDCVLEIADLMRASTLSAMAARATQGCAEPAAPVMLLNNGGARPPLYWIDAGPLIRTLALSLSSEQPVYALNLARRDEETLGREALGIPAIAAVLLRHLRQAQPAGPYYIAGWCRWGVVAQELACQLRDEGADVALLVLLDADVPNRGASVNQPLFALSGVRRLLRNGLAPRPQSQSFSQAVEQACRRHHVRTFDGDMLLIRPAFPAPRSERAWRQRTTGAVDVIRATGDHETMVRKPHVQSLGSQLDQHLIQAQRGQPHLAASVGTGIRPWSAAGLPDEAKTSTRYTLSG